MVYVKEYLDLIARATGWELIPRSGGWKLISRQGGFEATMQPDSREDHATAALRAWMGRGFARVATIHLDSEEVHVELEQGNGWIGSGTAPTLTAAVCAALIEAGRSRPN